MGHRFSKAAADNLAAKTTTTSAKTKTHTNNSTRSEQHKTFHKRTTTTTTTTTTNIIPIPIGSQQFVRSKINLQIQESPTTCHSSTSTTAVDDLHQPQNQQQQHTASSISSSLTSVNNLSCGRQIIIKIQLAKMENGNETAPLSQQQQDTSLESLTADCNLNSSELSTATVPGTQFLNLTLNSNCTSIANPLTTNIQTTTSSLPTSALASASACCRTAGSSLNKNNNYLNSNSSGDINNSNCRFRCPLSTSRNERPERLNTLQFNDEIVEQNIGEIVEYCEVLEQPQSTTPQTTNSNHMQMMSINEEPDNEANVCCRRKSKSLAANGGSSMSSSNNTGAKTKNRCRKCSCRDAFRRFLDPSLSRSSNKASKQQQQQQKEQKRTKSQDRHSNNNPPVNNVNKQQQQQQPQQQQPQQQQPQQQEEERQHQYEQQQRNTMHSTTFTTSTVTNRTTPTPVTSSAAAIVVPPTATNQVSLWGSGTTTSGNDVIIPLSTPAPQQFVVVQCAILNPANGAIHPLPTTTNASSTTNLPNNSLISIAHDISPTSNDLMVKVPSNTIRTCGTAAISPTAPIVHSQVDFVHYLVPDLERITNSSFYWGKMDRYEAERLLEGKPEGTFLLRDSAQEEFLFSVTFRKYGRSLHARIEQSGHRFSFDCHDPCVFTAPTVTGLLEHYKDPACVMFFEPMLTIPLHRKNCFSLQKLCRATIVSNTTYDGINELELPARLKSYLKEYHYKQKLRVKSNEPTYTIHCK